MTLTDCQIDKPPKTLTKDSLVKAWISQTLNLGKCEKKIRGIRSWKEKVLKNVSE